jgi:hypothetical protein
MIEAVKVVDAEGNVWSRRRIERQLIRHYCAKLSLSEYFQSTLMTKACLSEDQYLGGYLFFLKKLDGPDLRMGRISNTRFGS